MKPPIASRIVYTTEARGMSEYARSGFQAPKQLADQFEAMSVAMGQPHRVGISNAHADAWMASALGRFCLTQWTDRDHQWNNWRTGERYAQLIDADRIARGWTPRQCAATLGGLEPLTYQEAMDRRQRASSAIVEANEEMGVVSRDAAGAIYRLAWEDYGIADRLNGIAVHALYRLSIHFERLDKPKRF